MMWFGGVLREKDINIETGVERWVVRKLRPYRLLHGTSVRTKPYLSRAKVVMSYVEKCWREAWPAESSEIPLIRNVTSILKNRDIFEKGFLELQKRIIKHKCGKVDEELIQKFDIGQDSFHTLYDKVSKLK